MAAVVTALVAIAALAYTVYSDHANKSRLDKEIAARIQQNRVLEEQVRIARQQARVIGQQANAALRPTVGPVQDARAPRVTRLSASRVLLTFDIENTNTAAAILIHAVAVLGRCWLPGHAQAQWQGDAVIDGLKGGGRTRMAVTVSAVQYLGAGTPRPTQSCSARPRAANVYISYQNAAQELWASDWDYTLRAGAVPHILGNASVEGIGQRLLPIK